MHRLFRLAACVAALAVPLSAGELKGRVADERGEPMARVRVFLQDTEHQTVTAADGRFSFPSLLAGTYIVAVETVGYRLLKRAVTLGEGETTELEIVLSPDAFRRVDSIDVKADPFDLPQQAAATGVALSHSEIKDLSTVLVDDPIRAVQSLPGVVANNDFYSQFSVYGAPASSIGLYLDDILLHSPYHTIQGIRDAGSVSILNGDSIESLSLLPVAFPAGYGDRTGSALDIRSREGGRARPSFRAAASVAQASLLGEGPLGRDRRGSWIASVRRSYAQYIAGKLTDDPAQAFGFVDGQARLTRDLGHAHSVWLHATETRSEYDRSAARSRLGVNSLLSADYHITMGRAGWRFTPGEKLMVRATAGWMRERSENMNRDNRDLGGGVYGEWTAAAQGSWVWHGNDALEAGVSARRMRIDGFQNQFINSSAVLRVVDQFRGTALWRGGFVEQGWTWTRLRFGAGLRWDGEEGVQSTPVSPQASLGVHVAEGTEARFAWGEYAQFPDLQYLASPAGGWKLRPEIERHAVASIEQRVRTRVRVRIEAFTREHRDRIARPLLDPRWINGKLVLGPALPLYLNSVRGYVRGAQIMIQSRSANRVSGWVAYTLQYARDRDGVEYTAYWSPDDQRHTVNAYLGYRLTPSVHLSGKFIYGSGEPLPGFFRQAAGGGYYLTSLRNNVRVGDYGRMDLRANKSFVMRRSKLTLYGELINVTNHYNPRFTSYNGANSQTGLASVTIQKTFPIFPSGGVMFEF
jgi:hypothetical protein